MSNCLLIILVIGSFVTFGGFPSRFSKCCFHSFILSCWFAAFNFALAVLFLLFTSFVCQAILDCLSSTESLILSDFVCILSVLLDICLLTDIVPFLVFGHLCLLGSSDSFWRQFSQVHVFLKPLTFPMGLYLVLGFLEYTLMPPRGVHQRNSHIHHLGYLSLSSLVVSRICFLILIHICL